MARQRLTILTPDGRYARATSLFEMDGGVKTSGQFYGHKDQHKPVQSELSLYKRATPLSQGPKQASTSELSLCKRATPWSQRPTQACTSELNLDSMVTRTTNELSPASGRLKRSHYDSFK